MVFRSHQLSHIVLHFCLFIVGFVPMLPLSPSVNTPMAWPSCLSVVPCLRSVHLCDPYSVSVEAERQVCSALFVLRENWKLLAQITFTWSSCLELALVYFEPHKARVAAEHYSSLGPCVWQERPNEFVVSIFVRALFPKQVCNDFSMCVLLCVS